MATTHLTGAEEYLHTSFEHDAEYVQGRIAYRSAPKKPHSNMQGVLYRTLYRIGQPLGYRIWPEQHIRTQGNPARYRVPDLCVTLGEILSPDDVAADVSAKANEYLAFGVAYVWVVDPVSFGGEMRTRAGVEWVGDGRFRAGALEIDLGELR